MSTKVEQVGGTHYNAEYEHWDWVVDIGMTYLPATATKYLTRWRKKNGLQDLMKAQTYLEKLVLTWDTVYQFSAIAPDNVEELNLKFLTTNGLLGTQEGFICELLSDLENHDSIEKVHRALDKVKDLIAEVRGSAG